MHVLQFPIQPKGISAADRASRLRRAYYAQIPQVGPQFYLPQMESRPARPAAGG